MIKTNHRLVSFYVSWFCLVQVVDHVTSWMMAPPVLDVGSICSSRATNKRKHCYHQQQQQQRQQQRRQLQSSWLAQSFILDGSSSSSSSSDHGEDKIQQKQQQQEDVEDDLSFLMDRTARSKSGVLFTDVIEGLNRLYPPQELNQRNAASRTDGYWPYIQKGIDPPTETTYGEFNLYFFAQLLDKALKYYYQNDNNNTAAAINASSSSSSTTSISDQVFCDIGSGAGRLVMAAAALHPSLKKCRGIELLSSIHVVAETTLLKCIPQHHDNGIEKDVDDDDRTRSKTMSGSTRSSSTSFVDESDVLQEFEGRFVLGQDDEAEEEQQQQHDEDDVSNNYAATNKDVNHDADDARLSNPNTPLLQSYRLPSSTTDPPLLLAPMEFQCGSFEDEYFGDATLIFCFSSCMSRSILSKLSKAIGRSCQAGTIVMTTEFSLELDGVIDPLLDDTDDDDDYSHCTYNGDFDHEDDAEEWIRFVQEERIRNPIMNTPRSFQFELLETMEGPNWVTGGTSTAFLHRLVVSAKQKDNENDNDSNQNDESIDLEEQAAMAWIYAQKQNPQDFYRTVRNNMVFHGFDPRWYSGLVDGMD